LTTNHPQPAQPWPAATPPVGPISPVALTVMAGYRLDKALELLTAAVADAKQRIQNTPAELAAQTALMLLDAAQGISQAIGRMEGVLVFANPGAVWSTQAPQTPPQPSGPALSTNGCCCHSTAPGTGTPNP
jgi:hypothetical protein